MPSMPFGRLFHNNSDLATSSSDSSHNFEPSSINKVLYLLTQSGMANTIPANSNCLQASSSCASAWIFFFLPFPAFHSLNASSAPLIPSPTMNRSATTANNPICRTLLIVPTSLNGNPCTISNNCVIVSLLLFTSVGKVPTSSIQIFGSADVGASLESLYLWRSASRPLRISSPSANVPSEKRTVK
jgi:hypothetical protein